MIKLSYVKIPQTAVERVKKLMEDGIIGHSEVIAEFEESFGAWVGSKYAIAVSSGTMADTIALAVLKAFYPGKDEVIVPALTFIAQVNAITYNGLKPIFVDRYQEMGSTDKTLCHFPVHLLGKPSIRNKGSVPLIEDSCEAMGSSMWGKKCGTIGDLGTFSFFPSHTMTTGEGGMIVTDNKDYADLAKRLRNHGKISATSFHFDVIGFNGKMTSLQAAIGIESLKSIDSVIHKRRENFYLLGGMENPGETISPHAFPVICKDRNERDFLLKRLNDEGIECRNLFSSIPTQEFAYAYLNHRLGEFPIAEGIGYRGLYVPCHQGLSIEDITKIKEIINEKETQTSEVLINAN